MAQPMARISPLQSGGNLYTEDGIGLLQRHNGEDHTSAGTPDGTDYDGVKFTDLEVRSDDAPDKLKISSSILLTIAE